MTRWWSDEAKLLERGIDYDLFAALEYNPQDFDIEDVAKVLAIVEGERDEDNWLWIVALADGSAVLLSGGCDYTGWDCQSWVDAHTLDLEQPFFQQLATELPIEEAHRLYIQVLIGSPDETWHTRTGRELGLLKETNHA